MQSVLLAEYQGLILPSTSAHKQNIGGEHMQENFKPVDSDAMMQSTFNAQPAPSLGLTQRDP